jgi:hypothetical protein
MARKAAAKTSKRTMSDDHKAALAEGREQGRIVRLYLEALHSHAPKRGRKRTAESVQKRLAAVEEQLASADPLRRLQLIQERMDLETELAAVDGEGADMKELEAAFVEVAAAYGERKGLSYEAWRAVGVAPTVLSTAGIARSHQ